MRPFSNFGPILDHKIIVMGNSIKKTTNLVESTRRTVKGETSCGQTRIILNAQTNHIVILIVLKLVHLCGKAINDKHL